MLIVHPTAAEHWATLTRYTRALIPPPNTHLWDNWQKQVAYMERWGCHRDDKVVDPTRAVVVLGGTRDMLACTVRFWFRNVGIDDVTNPAHEARVRGFFEREQYARFIAEYSSFMEGELQFHGTRPALPGFDIASQPGVPESVVVGRCDDGWMIHT